MMGTRLGLFSEPLINDTVDSCGKINMVVLKCEVFPVFHCELFRKVFASRLLTPFLPPVLRAFRFPHPQKLPVLWVLLILKHAHISVLEQKL